ncbi:TetR/AcrR family transcriptional regulator [Paenibacillus oleatilyticus]|uniref:TetR/AcrR family transcriptional regulator n=1 Tax=Paenibacillus oleatilyticus TaxID=2594886 RepID=A0ABV4UV83_9BACL|nr:TetR/AcrR family transcriptional regulator [Paenibacillus oleatilyticus]MBU7317489.1 TetR/AcrR family transcriptional regulator [Paenibacillus oleatilyticus]
MSPRTREQNEEIRKQRKQEILQAAIRVYVDKGYSASEMGDIASQAGLAHGLVYYYFKNKKALFRELYEVMMEESRQFTKTFFEQEGSVFELFKNYAHIVCERVLEDPVIPRFYMRISLDLQHLYTPEEFSPFEWVKNFMYPMTQAIEKGIGQGTIQPGDANLMAMQFWGSVSQGMNYLDQVQQELIAQGNPETAYKEQLKKILDQVVESSVSLFKPQ